MAYPEHRQEQGACHKGHNSPLPDVDVPPYGVRIYTSGSLVLVKSNVPRPKQGGGQRGAVGVFSHRSRLYAKKRLGTCDANVLPLFCTLTYPDNFPPDPERWKRDLDAFLKRLFRRFPSAGVFWVREMKYRKSGDREGGLAPHYHLLVWGANLWAARDFFPDAWYEVVGSADERHLQAGTQVDLSRSSRGVQRYAAKYLTKAEGNDVQNEYPEGTGRWWGTRGKLPGSDYVDAYFTDRQRDQLDRLRRRFITAQGQRKYRRYSKYGCTVFVDVPLDWIRYAKMIGAVFRD